MSTAIKYCGLRDAQTIAYAATQGAAFIGLVHHLASPRHLPLEAMKHLAASTPPSVKHVAVLVAPDDAMLTELFQHYTPHYLQVHHLTDARRIDEIGKRFAVPMITAMSISSAEDLSGLAELEAVSAHMLFDAKNFGSGQAFDWHILAQKKPIKPWFLAGGLHAGNVTEAIRVTGAPIVDVSSGIEFAPGIKSPEKIADFYRAVLEARP